MEFSEPNTEPILSSMREMLDGHIEKLEAVCERSLANHRAVANEILADLSEIRGDVKGLSESLQVMLVRLTMFAAGVSVAIVLFQLLWQFPK